MRIDIITVLPEMLEGFVHESILARAQKKAWRDTPAQPARLFGRQMAAGGRLSIRRVRRHGNEM